MLDQEKSKEKLGFPMDFIDDEIMQYAENPSDESELLKELREKPTKKF